MPEVRFRISDEDYKKLEAMAEADGKTIQDYVRIKLFGHETIFNPAEAMKRALAKYKKEDAPFSLPDLYTDEEWSTLSRGLAGAFGKAFFKYVTEKNPGKIKHCRGGNTGHRAEYQIM